ncbi:MAG: PAS domain-containing protein, partial [Anaerolineales bacterium]
MADKKNNRNERPDLAELHRQAEAKLAERRKKTGPLPSMDTDIRRLVHELEVHQIELEMQNEELMQTWAEREAVLKQYTDLYDFAPIGYFTLARDGTIRMANLTGANLLGVERGKLIERRFGQFVIDEYRTAFIDFLERVFECNEKESFQVELRKEAGEACWVQIEAVWLDDEQECRATVVD